MKGNQNIYEQIEKYLDKEIGEEEFKNFCQAFSQEEIDKKISIVKSARTLVINNSLLQFQNRLKQEESKYLKNEGNNKIWLFSILFVVLFSGLFCWLYFLQKLEPEKKELPSASLPASVSENKLKETIPNTTVTESAERLNPPKIPVAKKKLNKTPIGDTIGQVSEKIVFYPNPVEKVVKDSVFQSNSGDKSELNNRPVMAPQNSCATKHMMAEVVVEPTCSGEEKGKIMIQNLRGGNQPYTFEMEHSDTQSSGIFTGLAHGSYTIIIRDKDGCEKIYDHVVVKSVLCKRNYDFNPHAGEVWEVPKEFGKGALSIFDKNGKLVFKKDISPEMQVSWSGASATGEINSGYYMYSFQREDGSVEHGSITISGR